MCPDCPLRPSYLSPDEEVTAGIDSVFIRHTTTAVRGGISRIAVVEFGGFGDPGSYEDLYTINLRREDREQPFERIDARLEGGGLKLEQVVDRFSQCPTPSQERSGLLRLTKTTVCPAAQELNRKQ
jgi:hypothetical protein